MSNGNMRNVFGVSVHVGTIVQLSNMVIYHHIDCSKYIEAREILWPGITSLHSKGFYFVNFFLVSHSVQFEFWAQ